MKILIINGPNLNLLGQRDTHIYGDESLADVNAYIRSCCGGDELEFFQSNHEGEIIDKIHEAMKEHMGIIINPGAYAHYSYAIRDAIEAVRVPVVEVHLSDISKREKFRQISVTSPVCSAIISGKGKEGYVMAIEKLKSILTD